MGFDIEKLGQGVNPEILELILKETAHDIGLKVSDGASVGAKFRLNGGWGTGMSISPGKKIEGKVSEVMYWTGIGYGISSEKTRKNYFDKIREKINKLEQ
jgi:hypothetical protein